MVRVMQRQYIAIDLKSFYASVNVLSADLIRSTPVSLWQILHALKRLSVSQSLRHLNHTASVADHGFLKLCRKSEKRITVVGEVENPAQRL